MNSSSCLRYSMFLHNIVIKMEQDGAFVENESCENDQFDIISQLHADENTHPHDRGPAVVPAREALNDVASSGERDSVP